MAEIIACTVKKVQDEALISIVKPIIAKWFTIYPEFIEKKLVPIAASPNKRSMEVIQVPNRQQLWNRHGFLAIRFLAEPVISRRKRPFTRVLIVAQLAGKMGHGYSW